MSPRTAFCRSLMECRDPFDGRNLLLLACGAGSALLVDLLLTHAERSGGSSLDAHARSHSGETALHLAAASGHLEICKMLLSRTSLQLKGPAAESLHYVTPLQLAGKMHWQLALQRVAFVCGPLANEHGSRLVVAIQEGLAQRLEKGRVATVAEAAQRLNQRRVTSVADIWPNSFPGSSFTILPDRLAQIRQQVASSAHMVVVLSRALLCEPTALVALVAAYDFGKTILGVQVDGMEEGVRYDEEEAKRAFHNLPLYLTNHHPDVLAAMEASGLDAVDIGRKCLNVARNLTSRHVVTIDLPSTLADDAYSPRQVLTLDDESLKAIELGLEEAQPLDLAVKEARSRLVIRNRVSRRISSLRTRARVALKNRTAQEHLLKRVSDGNGVVLPPLDDVAGGHIKYHLFISHQWRLGQDVVRVIKLRLSDLAPSMRIFVDVDNNRNSPVESVDSTLLVMVFVVDGYFSSLKCMRELLRAMWLRKPIAVLVEPDADKGGLTGEQIRQQIDAACANFGKWGLKKELREWGLPTPPTAQEIFEALFPSDANAPPPLEWSPLSLYQNCTLRLLAERVLQDDQKPTRLQSELAVQEIPWPACKRNHFHIFVSRHCKGSMLLMNELAERQQQKEKEGDDAGDQEVLQMTTNVKSLSKCAHMLVYLTADTWGEEKDIRAFVQEVKHAKELGVHLLLVHELPGLELPGKADDRQSAAVKFEKLLADAPKELVDTGLLSRIAVPLKPEPYRQTSMLLLMQAIIDSSTSIPGGGARDSHDELRRPSHDIMLPNAVTANAPAAASSADGNGLTIAPPALLNPPREPVPMWLLSPAHKSTQRLLVARSEAHAKHRAAREFYKTANPDERPPTPPGLPSGLSIFRSGVAPPPLSSSDERSS